MFSNPGITIRYHIPDQLTSIINIHCKYYIYLNRLLYLNILIKVLCE